MECDIYCTTILATMDFVLHTRTCPSTYTTLQTKARRNTSTPVLDQKFSFLLWFAQMQQIQSQTGQNTPHYQHINPRLRSKRIRILLERTVHKKLLIFVAVNFKLDMILTQKKEKKGKLFLKKVIASSNAKDGF